MIENCPKTSPYSAAIAEIKANMAKCVTTLAMLEQMHNLWLASEGADQDAPLAAEQSKPKPPADTSAATAPKEATEYPFYGMDLSLAATKQIETKNRPLTARQIWNSLSEAGFPTKAREPVITVSWALKRRETTHGDVTFTTAKTWGLRKWYTPEEIEAFERARGGMGGRPREEHGKKTSDGIKNVLAEGKLWGRRSTTKPEDMERAYRAIQRGSSKLAAAKAAGIAWPTFNWYWQRFEVENWKPGQPWPPPRRTVELKGPFPREKMWPVENGHTNGHANGNGPQLELQPVTK